MKNWENEPATERQKARIAWWSKRLNRHTPEFHTKEQAGSIIDDMLDAHPEIQEEWFQSSEHIQSQREEIPHIVEKYRDRYNCKYVSPAIIDEVVGVIGLRHSSHPVDRYAESFFAALATPHPELFANRVLPPPLPPQNMPHASLSIGVPIKPKAHRGDWICTQCGHIGRPIRIAPGGGCVEIALWILLCFPGIIYTVWRITCKYKACKICKSRAVIPAESPKGLQIADVYKSFADGSDVWWIPSVVLAIVFVVIVVIASVYFEKIGH